MAEENETQQGGEEQPQAEQQSQEQVETPQISKDARMWAMFCHLAGLGIFIIPLVGNIVAPLVIWQLKKDDDPFINDQGKEAVNFQISITVYSIISMLLFVACVGPFLLGAVIIVDLILLLIAAVKANNGQAYNYPFTIRLIK